MIELQIRLLIFLAAGYILGKKKVISKDGASAINVLVMNLFLPCSIFHAFETALTREIIESTFSILILAILLQIAAIFLSRVLWKIVKDPTERINLEYGTVSNNAGTLGLVVGQAAFGQEGALFTSIYAIPLRIVMWSYGLMMYSRAENVKWKDVLKKTAVNPCMIAIFAGIIMMTAQSFGFLLPDWLDTVIASFAGCNTVLIMVVIGVILSSVPLSDLLSSRLILYTLFRLILLPAACCGLLALFHVPSMPLMICTLETAMPAPVTMAMLSQKYKQNEQFASRMIFLSTVVSMFTLPLWTILLKALF